MRYVGDKTLLHPEGELDPVEQPIEGKNKAGEFVAVVLSFQAGTQIRREHTIYLIHNTGHRRHGLSGIKPSTRCHHPNTQEEGDE